MTTGEKIKELRKARGLTQEELGEKIGVQKAAINKYETGVVVNLKQTTIFSLAKALGVSPVELLDGDEAQPSSIATDESYFISLFREADDRARADAIEILKKHKRG